MTTVLVLGIVGERSASAVVPRAAVARAAGAAAQVLRVRCHGQLAHRAAHLCHGVQPPTWVERRAPPLARRCRHVATLDAAGMGADGHGRRRVPDFFVVAREDLDDGRSRLQRTRARFDRRVASPGAMYHDAHAPPAHRALAVVTSL